MASTGFNKIDDIFKKRGQYRLLPYGGIYANGVTVGTVTAAAGVVTIPVTAGKIMLDSRDYTLTAGNAVTAALPNGMNNVEVWLNPVRKTPAVNALPGTAVEGDTVFLVMPADTYASYLDKIYVYRSGNWIEKNSYVNPAEKDAIYESNSSYFRNLPFSDITGAVISTADEKSIIYKPNMGMPIDQKSATGAAYARYSTGIKIATVKVTLTAGGIATPATDVVVTTYKPALLPV